MVCAVAGSLFCLFTSSWGWLQGNVHFKVSVVACEQF